MSTRAKKTNGFIPEPTHYRLNFSDGPLEGLQVTVRSVSIRRRISFNKVRFTLPQTAEEADNYIEDMYAEFIDRVVDWNLRDEDGNVVPKTVDGLMDQDENAVQEIIKAWIDILDNNTKKKEETGQDFPTTPEFDPGQIPMTGI